MRVRIEDILKIVSRHYKVPRNELLSARRSRDVVRRRYGLLDGRQAKLADIGSHWGITAERVRQIERAALATLRARHTVAA